MAKIAPMIMRITKSPSPDVVGYKLYMETAPNPVTYESLSFDLGDELEVDMSKLPGIHEIQGTYNVGVTSIDSAGNESSMRKADNIKVDFTPPDPPQSVEFVRLS